jgi:hypothetical protein
VHLETIAAYAAFPSRKAALLQDTASRDADTSNASYTAPGSVPDVCLQAQLKKDTIMANSNFPQAGLGFYIQSNLTDSAGNTYVANVEVAEVAGAAAALGVHVRTAIRLSAKSELGTLFSVRQDVRAFGWHVGSCFWA